MVLEISRNKLQLPHLSNLFRKKNKEETADVATASTAEHHLTHHSFHDITLHDNDQAVAMVEGAGAQSDVGATIG